jgi:hypothetical protein
MLLEKGWVSDVMAAVDRIAPSLVTLCHDNEHQNVD